MNPNYTTDGPWSSDSEFISSPDGFIAQVVERDTPRETEANGRLIASAPELLAALEFALEAVIYFHNNEEDNGMLDQVRAAIAKANGGAL